VAKTGLNYIWRVVRDGWLGLVQDVAKTLLNDVFAELKRGPIGEAIKWMFRFEGMRDALGLRRRQQRK
jgi:hypothetical protein